ncbi:hypothetical protein O59_000050 [Cellvibrio sp. BR]|uniref:hypothetical protein n=1 Tax=unclassified Cellvibrio TaxID=2624793 RepID=UPI0002600F99|nr:MULTISPECIES: hypothetical protein [unclassified Cellvibrio]EIK46029.1 hypothetical protein O59_000050 [Cellvibrio sp. BR]UUA72028.1 hypothetical protein NNX04_16605 [Cellvibrio sp. QJXJ]
MMSGLSQLLGLTANAAPTIYPRQVDLSGNIFHFAMPENFSKDMPAENMVEKLDIEDLKKFDNPEYGNIIRRWWDIKKPGFFGKELGTVMMDISVQRVPNNKKKLIHINAYNIANRLDFLLMINDTLHQRYDELNKNYRGQGGIDGDYSVDFCYLLGSEIESDYRDYNYNGQKWIGYTVTAPNAQLIVGLVTPVTQDTYIELVFTFSPNHDASPNEFLDVAHMTTQLIEDSLRVNYAANNPIKQVIENEWPNTTNNETLALHKDKLLIPLFGPNIYQRLEESQKKALELKKELDRPLEE